MILCFKLESMGNIKIVVIGPRVEWTTTRASSMGAELMQKVICWNVIFPKSNVSVSILTRSSSGMDGNT